MAKKQQSVADMIAGDTQVAGPSNEQLEQIVQLAEMQLTILGEGLEDGPNRDSYDNLAAWAKKNDLTAEDVLPGVPLSQLVKALMFQLKQLQRVQLTMLPDAMASIGGGLTEFKLASGYKITIKDDIQAGIRKGPDDQPLPEAFAWLEGKGLGDVIKDDVTVKFGRGESANELLEYCHEHGMSAAEKLSVHPSTLKSLVKEQMELGVEFPPDYFSIHPFRKAIIKLPKGK